MKKLIFILLVFIGMINSVYAFDNDGGGAWAEYMSFPITTAPTENAQYKIVINNETWELYNVTGGLEASGTNTNFWSLVNSSGFDIRVFNQNYEQLYFWIESWDYTNKKAIIWVNLTAGSTELNIAYGNPDALQSSFMNASLTFIYYDKGDKITEWTVVGTNTGQDTSVGNPAPSYKAESVRGDYLFRRVPGLTNRSIIEYDMMTTGLGNFYVLVNSTGYGQMYRLDSRPSNRGGTGATTSWTIWSCDENGDPNIATNTWYRVKLVLNSTHLIGYVNGIQYGIRVLNEVPNNDYIGLVGDNLGAGYYSWWDNIIIYKFADPADFGTPSVKTFSNPLNIYEDICENDPSCVLYLSFDMIARDLSNYSNNVTVYGDVIYINGKHDYALKFGSGINDDRVEVQDSPLLNPQEITVAAWIKITDTGGSYIVMKGDPTTYGLFRDNIQGNKMCFTTNFDGDYPNSCVWSNTEILNNIWYFVVGTFDGQYLRIYINGKLENEKLYPNPIPNSTTPLFIGYSGDLPPPGISAGGIIDEVLIFNRSLTEEEIKQLYERGYAKFRIFNEKTLEPIANASLTFQIKDLNYTTIKEIQTNESEFGAILQKGNYILTFLTNDDYPYPRQIYFETTFPEPSVQTFNFYLLSKNESEHVILNKFHKIDHTYEFPSNTTLLKLKKNINNKLETIHSVFFDFNDYAQAYLILTDRYQLCIHEIARDEERCLGYFTPDPDGLVKVVVSTITLPEIVEKWLDYEFKTDKNTGLIQFSYNSTINISKSEMWVNLTNGTQVFYTSSTANSASLLYYAQNTSTNYIVTVKVTNILGDTFEISQYVIWNKEAYLRGKFDIMPKTGDWKYVYMAIAVGIVIMTVLIFSEYRAEVATALGAGMFLFFYFIGWVDVNPVAVALVTIIAAAALITKGRKEVER